LRLARDTSIVAMIGAEGWMAKSYRVFLWFAAIASALVMAILFSKEGPTYGFMFAGILVCGAGLTLVLRSPAGLAFIEKRPKAVVTAGASALAVGVFGGVTVILFSVRDSPCAW
jgi:hypothetical protein